MGEKQGMVTEREKEGEGERKRERGQEGKPQERTSRGRWPLPPPPSPPPPPQAPPTYLFSVTTFIIQSAKQNVKHFLFWVRAAKAQLYNIMMI